MEHVVLIGDSVFDNAAYIGGGPDVSAQIAAALPVSWKVTRNAKDGSETKEALSQLTKLPRGASLIMVSIGGNDALHHLGMLSEKATSVAQVLDRLDKIVNQFQASYRRLLSKILATGLPSAVCTIYTPEFEDADLNRRALTVLRCFNDVIITEASCRSIPILDLRRVFTLPTDYVNQYEPSVKGGRKLANAIAAMALESRHHLKNGMIYS
jgi:lysophospholipase L1-like esterase